ncbi:hypothetical protein IE077_000808, partial [Cardiosporidium cionae]
EVHSDPNLHLEQVKEIKYDKVKMRALRTLKLLEAATTEGKVKQKKGRQKGKETSNVIQAESASPEDVGIKSPLGSTGSVEGTTSRGPEIHTYLPSSPDVLHVKRTLSDVEENDTLARINAKPKKRHRVCDIDLSSVSKEELSTRARKVLKPVKKTLKSLKQTSNDEKCTDHEVIGLMKRSLPRVGDKICEALDMCANEISREKLDTACWEYVSKYTVASGGDLKRVYIQLCGLNVASKDSFQNPSPRVKWEGQHYSPAVVDPSAASPTLSPPVSTSPNISPPNAASPKIVSTMGLTTVPPAVIASSEIPVQVEPSVPAAITKTSLPSSPAADTPTL